MVGDAECSSRPEAYTEACFSSSYRHSLNIKLYVSRQAGESDKIAA